VKKAIEAVKVETDEEGDQRRERQRFENFKAPGEKRPGDEFYDVDGIENECLEPPIDISPESDREFLKFIIKKSKSKFQRCCEDGDCVYYTHETRFDTG
jgi:hypothetical protein